jgi:hypothetical protein
VTEGDIALAASGRGKPDLNKDILPRDRVSTTRGNNKLRNTFQRRDATPLPGIQKLHQSLLSCAVVIAETKREVRIAL